MSEAPILVVDDEPGMVELVSLYLRREGFRVEVAYDGQTALEKFRALQPQLIVLDLMLPGVDGWEVCQRIRQESDVPVLMLTARDEETDRVAGLELGADDYVTKPFSPRELVARVKAILRRTARSEEKTMEKPPVWEWKEVRIDPGRREVLVHGQPLVLRPKEFDLLWTLAQHADLVLTREQLIRLAWGYDYLGDTRTIDVHVGYLRRKLAAANVTSLKIVTKRGAGYLLEKC